MQSICLRLQSGKLSQVNQQRPYISRKNIINQAAGQEWHEESAGHLEQLESNNISKTWELVGFRSIICMICSRKGTNVLDSSWFHDFDLLDEAYDEQ